MNVLGELNIAGLERLSADPVDNLFEGRMFLRSTDNKPRIYIGGIWSYIADNIDITGAVASVNGLEGVVVLTTSNIAEGTREYFTVAKAKAASVDNAIQDNVTDKAPSQEAVHTALAGKQNVGSYLTQLTGDVSAVGPGIGSTTLSSTGVSPGTYTKIQVDAKGRVLSGTSLISSDIPSLPANKLPQATNSVDGYLSATDWNTFNNKQAAGNYLTGLTGDVVASGPGIGTSALSDTGVTPGVYTKVTVDSKGRVTTGGSLSDADVTSKVLTGLTPTGGDVTATDSIVQAVGKLAYDQVAPWFGDGSTGVGNITSNTTMLSNYYCTDLNVASGFTLNTSGYAVYVKGTLDLQGKISRDGNNGGNGAVAAGGTAGAAHSNSTFVGGGGAGGVGGTANGSVGISQSGVLGGRGGSAGAGLAGAGGGSPAFSNVSTALGGLASVYLPQCLTVARLVDGTKTSAGGGGSGGGGGTGGTGGGGGGSGGGVVLIVANRVTGSGQITAKGGNGGNSYDANGGGGGGGGGGAILLATRCSMAGSSITYDVSGGTGGTGYNNGVTGNVGNIFITRL